MAAAEHTSRSLRVADNAIVQTLDDLPSDQKIVIQGAREHNLKNVDLAIPRNRMVVFTGLSGSGKSSLAFDTLFAEGQRRYVESLSAYARQFLGQMDKPDVDFIEGLSPAVSIDQKTTNRNPRSTVGTITEIYDYLRLLYARVGIPHCPVCGEEVTAQTPQQIVDTLMKLPERTRFQILSPVARGRKGEFVEVLETLRSDG
ncbi:MAG: excinuclease ABC subunit A, partial [Scardovia wiggsiae]